MGKPKKTVVPKMDNSFIHIDEVNVGQKVYFSPTQREPFEVTSKQTKTITILEMKNGLTKIKLSGNKFVSKEPFTAPMGAESGGFYGKNGFWD